MQHQKLTRRSFVQTGLLSAVGMSMPLGASRLLAEQSESRSADAVLFLNLMGGPSHFETLDMKPEADAELKGEFKTIQSKVPELFVSEYLPKFAATADKYALVRGISHSTGDHPQGQQYLGSATGRRRLWSTRRSARWSVASDQLTRHFRRLSQFRAPSGMAVTWAMPSLRLIRMPARRRVSRSSSAASRCRTG